MHTFTLAPLQVTDHVLELSFEVDAASDIVSAIITQDAISQEHEAMHGDLVAKLGRPPSAADWQAFADSLRLEFKVTYLSGYDEPFKAITHRYFEKYPNPELEGIVATTVLTHEWIDPRPRTQRSLERDRKRRRKAQRQARKASRR